MLNIIEFRKYIDQSKHVNGTGEFSAELRLSPPDCHETLRKLGEHLVSAGGFIISPEGDSCQIAGGRISCQFDCDTLLIHVLAQDILIFIGIQLLLESFFKIPSRGLQTDQPI